MDGKALVRLAQLRGRVATLARGGRYDGAALLLGDLVRADLALGLPADGLLRARQAAALAETRGLPMATPLVVLAAALLAAGSPAAAIDATELALTQIGADDDRARIEVMVALVAGSAHRREGRLAEARVLLDRARSGAARRGAAALAGFALAELGRVDLAEDHGAEAAVCFEFAAEFFRRAAQPETAVEAAALALAVRADGGDLDAASAVAPRVADEARALGRLDLLAFVDGALADATLARAPDAATQACALAAETADAMPESPLARDLRAQARLRQARIAVDAQDRDRHLEAGVDLARSLSTTRAGMLLGAHLVALVDARVTGIEIERVCAALEATGDAELARLARELAGATRA